MRKVNTGWYVNTGVQNSHHSEEGSLCHTWTSEQRQYAVLKNNNGRWIA